MALIPVIGVPGFSVEPGQPRIRAEPERTVPALVDLPDVVAAQSVLHCKPLPGLPIIPYDASASVAMTDP